MNIAHLAVKRIKLRMMLSWLLRACLLGGLTLAPAAPALAQAAAGEAQKPAAEQKEEPPTTSGPIITDYTIPIDKGKLTMMLLFANEFGTGNFSNSWRQVSAHEDFYNFYTNFKVYYGLAKNLETSITIPYVHRWIENADLSVAGPNGERSASFDGIGDIFLEGKYLLLPETDYRPAVAGVFGLTLPTGHASHLNPARLGTDSPGAGALIFTPGVNLFKYIKPFLLYGQVWYNAPVNMYQQRPDNVRSRDTITFNLAAEYPINEKWVLLAEIFSNWTWTNINPINQSFATTQTQIGVAPAIEYIVSDKLNFALGAGFELFGKNGDTEIYPWLMVNYSVW